MGEDIVCSDLERIGGEASQSIAARRSSTLALIKIKGDRYFRRSSFLNSPNLFIMITNLLLPILL